MITHNAIFIDYNVLMMPCESQFFHQILSKKQIMSKFDFDIRRGRWAGGIVIVTHMTVYIRLH